MLLSTSQADRTVARWQVIHEEEEKQEERHKLLQVKLIGAERGDEIGLLSSMTEMPSQSLVSSKYKRSLN